MPNGFKTTEFWVTMGVLIVGLVLVLTNHLDGDTYWQWAAVGGAGYAVSRGLAKTEPVPPKED